MSNKSITNIVNLTLLVFGLLFMFVPMFKGIILLGIGIFISSVLTLLFNNIQ